MYVNRKEEEDARQNNNYRATNLPKVTLVRLHYSSQTTSPPLTLTFIIHNQYYVNTLFIYIHKYVLLIVLFTTPSIKMILLI